MENELNELLEEIAKLNLKTYKPDEPNLFYMLGIEHNEVLICRLIAALIQPNGLHGLGTKSLEVFLEQIGITEFGNLDTAEVVLEEKIDNDRRVDIVIYLENEVVPIEVKIYAKDQPQQLYDYYNYYLYRHQNHHSKKINKIYYLTLNQHKPSKNSITSNDGKDKLDINQFECICFEKQIINWLNFISEIISKKESKISNIIKNFKEVIDRMGNRNSEKLKIFVNSGLDDSKLKALLMVMENKDNLWDEIRYTFLKNSLECATHYTLEKYDKDEEFEKIDTHCKYVVKRENEIIAYICIEVNLYIVRKTVSIPQNNNGWENYENINDCDYKWKYIKYDGGKSEWNLKDIDTTLNSTRKITWSNYLND